MTLKNWNPEDYRFDYEPVYYQGEIVKAPLIHKAIEVYKYLLGFIIPDAAKAFKSGGELSCLLTTFCIVDYLTGYYSGKQSTEKTFTSFVEKYFPQEYQFMSEALYQLRCGLVHNLVFFNPWKPSVDSLIIEENSPSHLQVVKGKFVFSILHFLEDTRRATIMYFYDLIMHSDENLALVNNFHKRFNRKNGAASVMLKT
jgi:hypothetical protein